MHAPEPLAELGVKVMGLFTDSGYTCEVAVPMAYVTERQGEDWDKVRLNVTIDDRDGEDGLCQVWWRPHWSSGDSFPGSGTFGASGERRVGCHRSQLVTASSALICAAYRGRRPCPG